MTFLTGFLLVLALLMIFTLGWPGIALLILLVFVIDWSGDGDGRQWGSNND